MDSDFKQPGLSLYVLIHNAHNYGEVKPLTEYLITQNNIHIYKKMIEKNILPYNKEDLDHMSTNIEKIISNLESEQNNDLENETHVFNIKKKICEFYAQICDVAKFKVLCREIIEKEPSLSLKMDIYLCFIRLAIITNDKNMLSRNILKATGIFESTCDWDRKNRFKVYFGLYNLMKGDFKKAAELFSESLASFDAKELLPFEKVVFYLVFSGLLGFNRLDIKKHIIDNSEIQKHAQLLKLPECYYDCDYQNYFRILSDFLNFCIKDPFLLVFINHFCKELKIKAYNQLLTSYKSLHLTKMAELFNTNQSYIENDLVDFINDGKMGCMIDKVSGTVHITNSINSSENEICVLSGEKVLKCIKKSVH